MIKEFEYVDKNFKHMVEDLQDICHEPSIAARNTGMKEGADKVCKKMKSLGMECRIMPTDGGFPVVFGELKGETDKTILFYNHYDVQPPEPLDKWKYPPFGAEVHDDKLYGRGVSDNKGSLFSRLEAIEAVLNENGKLPVNVKFLVEGEEEMGSPHLEKFVKANKDLFDADACIWELAAKDENGNPMARLGSKGMLYVELSVTTANTDFHSKMAPVVPNAAWRLVWALSSLKDENENILIDGIYDKIKPIPPEELEILNTMCSQEEKLRKRSNIKEFLGGVKGSEYNKRLYTGMTCTICGIESGYTLEGQKTVLPCTAKAKLDFRLVVDQDPDEIVQLLRKHLNKHGFSDIKIKVLTNTKPAKTSVTTPFMDIVRKSAAMVYDKPIVIETTAAGTGPRSAISDWSNMPIVALGPSYAGSRNHSPNENIKLEDYREAIKHIIALMYCFAEK